MLRSRGFWLALLLVIILAGVGGYLYYNNTAVATAAEDQPEVQTSVVRRGDITISATGAGTVIPADEVLLSFSSGGTLAELFVQVGDEVQAGDPLARLDDTSARQTVANAELQLENASLQTDPDARERTLALAQIAVDQAEINRDSAQADLDELLSWEPDEAAVALAQANLEAAQANLEDAIARDAASGNSLTSARISVEQAERSLADAQEAYDTAYDPGREWELNDPRRADRLENERAAAENALVRAQENLDIAHASYNLAVSNLSNDNALSAKTSLLNAQNALDDAMTGPTEAEIEAARIRVRQAELSLQQALLNQASTDDNQQAEISQAQAEMNLEAAQKALEETTLVAPMDGTVMAINAHPGESVGAGFITLANLELPILEVYLDETDMDKAVVGYEVDVTFDALPDDVFIGHVLRVDPQLSNVSGVTAVRAIVQLDADTFAKPQTFPVGLNATVDVIGGRAEGALLVPVEALRELSPGHYAVFVMENGEPKLRQVEVGLMDFTFAEILSGLELGDVVTTGILQTQ